MESRQKPGVLALIFVWTGLLFLNLINGRCQAKILNCRGIAEYNDEHQICCAGKITELVDNEQCCGGEERFNPTRRICCGGRVQDRYQRDNNSGKKKEQQCCGGQLSPTEGILCCHGNPLKLNQLQESDRDFLECCSATTFANRSHQFCCGGQTYNQSEQIGCCNNQAYIKDHKQCHNDLKIIGLYEDFCGETLYNMQKASCCGGKVNYLMPAMKGTMWNEELRCCGHIPYNSTSTKCCPRQFSIATAHTISRNMECCGDTHYDPTKQVCIKRQKPMPIVPNHQYCGFHSYNPSGEEQCCGGNLYNSSTHQCCDGFSETKIILKNQTCCGGNSLKSNQLCCFNKSCPKTSKEDNQCCYNFSNYQISTYCDKTHTCNGLGQVVPKEAGRELCGNNLSYRPEEEFCCFDSLKRKDEGFNACCDGQQHYDDSRQICCGGKVHNIKPEDGQCCMDDGNVYLKQDLSNPCLRKCSKRTFYDPYLQVCCSGKVYKAKDNKICCGKKYINSLKRVCCGEMVSIKRNGSKQCCGTRAIKKKKYECCGERLAYNNKTHGCCHSVQLYRRRDYSCMFGNVTLNKRLEDMMKRLSRPTLRHIMCDRGVMKHGDRLIQVACGNYTGVTGTFKDPNISRRNNGTYKLDAWISLTKEVDIHRGFFTSQNEATPQELSVVITLSVANDIRCKLKHLEKLKNREVIIFSDKTPVRNTLTIGEHDFVYLTKLTNLRRRNLKQLQLQPGFCQFVPKVL